MPRGGKGRGAGARKILAEMGQRITSFTLLPQTLELLDQRARSEGKSRSQIGGAAIFHYLSKGLRKFVENPDTGLSQG